MCISYRFMKYHTESLTDIVNEIDLLLFLGIQFLYSISIFATERTLFSFVKILVLIFLFQHEKPIKIKIATK